jgi:phage terminase small subunit
MRGRKPLPNVVKLQRASRQPRNPDEPVHRLAAGDPPDGLDESSLRVWLEAVPELARVGLFAVSDVGRVTRTCQLEALGRRKLDEATKAKSKDAPALLRVAAACFALTDKVWTSFGVAAPGDRARLRMPPREEDDLEAFKAKHRA